MPIFAGGGVASIAEGVLHVRDPRPLENPLWTYLTLAVAAIAEGYSLFVAYREFRNSASQDDGLWPAIHRSKDPSIFAVLFEDAAALLGILAAFLGFCLGACAAPSLSRRCSVDRHWNHLDGNSSPPGE